MDAISSIRLINSAGGDTSFASLIGIEKTPGYQQRVNNWKRRGIPDSVVLRNYELFQRLIHPEEFPAPERSAKEAA